MNLHGRNLLKDIDLTAGEFTYLIDLELRARAFPAGSMGP
jgi:hypothetical protein